MTLQPDIPLSRQHIRQQIRERRRALSPEQQRLFAQQARRADDGLAAGRTRSYRGAVPLL